VGTQSERRVNAVLDGKEKLVRNVSATEKEMSPEKCEKEMKHMSNEIA